MAGSGASDLVEVMVGALVAMSPERLAAVLGDTPERSAPWVRAAAEWGLAEAQLRYGRMLLEGQGVTRDPAQALAWFELAAEGGEGEIQAEARNMVGRCRENGWGAPADPAIAAEWYRLAAEAGSAWAQYNLGHLLLDGLGVPRDPKAALTWYRRAAEQGHPRAMNLVGRCLEQGWGAPKDPAAARDWYRRSAEGGYFRGQFNYASVLRAEGRLEEADALFAAALAGAPAISRGAMTEALARLKEAA
ncbi:tetratricopeptide repeat protein [Phenylobacterium montanum]|uniref:Sel1 repeat family protein n=1 Tax=Phenylobacterium montanum TaxID=2823693 RepID=A0A975G1U4_9CAUL|nr:tetratricopeptide repeat protein [Caulobacter sp. S6]QUD89224.1 sel1 repeat family protein [Caulobacter sp. S6]